MQPHLQRVLVTGLNGFTGYYLAAALERAGYEVHGTVRPGDPSGPWRHAVDLSDTVTLSELISAVKPTHVIHLAAVSFVAYGDVDEIYRTNLLGTRNVLSALARWSSSAKRLDNVILASSANVYGNSDISPLCEDSALYPANDYAVSKLAMEKMAALWSDTLPITIVRPFNYTGVGQSEQFLIPKIVNAYSRRLDSLELGNLDVWRDFSDVRDIAEVYVGLLRASPCTILNICSEHVYKLSDILEVVSSLSGHRLDVRVNPKFMRGNEIKVLQGSAARLRNVLPEWRARPLTETLAWMLSNPSKPTFSRPNL